MNARAKLGGRLNSPIGAFGKPTRSTRAGGASCDFAFAGRLAA